MLKTILFVFMKKISIKQSLENESLALSHPHLANEWHPIKNGSLCPEDINAKSLVRVWWKCPKGPDHEWDTRVTDRVRGPRCAFCLNQRASVTNSLRTLHPKLAQTWHPTKNDILTPDEVVGSGYKKFWWQCSKNSSHSWEASISSRVRKDDTYRDCPLCKSTPLSITNPEIAKQWHSTKNGLLKPSDVVAGSATYAWWKCDKGNDHEWKTKIVERLKSGCPFCDGKKLSITNSLEARYPELAKEWHPTKNAPLQPNNVFGGGKKKFWWKCSKENDHEWEACIQRRAQGQGCSICRGLKVVKSNCLASTHPDLIKQWHPTKNQGLTPYDVIAGNSNPVWWVCQKNSEHEWQTSCKNRIKQAENIIRGCPYCCNQKICKSNSLAVTNPELAKEWHTEKNGNLTPYDITEGSGITVWWLCSQHKNHEWRAKPANRSWGNGCPLCNGGWTIDKVRLFVLSLIAHIDHLTPAELYVIFQQHGVSTTSSKSQTFLKALKTGKFPKEELEKFANDEPSLVDKFISDPSQNLEEHSEALLDESQCLSENKIDLTDEQLPVIETKDVLAILDNKLTANIDKEAIDFFVDSATAKIWRHVFLDEGIAIKQLDAYSGCGEYSDEVKRRFMEQYHGAVNLNIPTGYNFKVNGKIYLPNLMQRFTAFMIQKMKRFGNWSGTGAGKTLSAILSSRVIDAKFSIICCPNSVVKGWRDNIEAIYPDSVVMTKDLTVTSSPWHHYIILNYEFFQQPNSESQLKHFLNSVKVDFVVIDEIHYSKQRVVEDISKRKKVISAMLSEAARLNKDLHVLGMSATPVINNLFEGKTLIELITGLHHDELDTKPSVGNCIALYQKFVSKGLRWLPQYKQHLNVQTVEIDCSSFIEEIKNVSLNGSMVDLESILTKAKTSEILRHLKSKTIVYTHYIKNILHYLEEAIKSEGWKTAVYSGEDKSGLEEFLIGDVDILIATSCIGTGVDGLQNVCNRIIINTLPWTNAEFEQLKGRVYRQGQRSDNVDIIIPLTYAFINGERWSWCDSKWKRIQFKKSISDAAVDGVIPEGHLRTLSQAYQDVMKWLTRLENGGINEIERRKIDICLSDQQQKVALRKFGDFSKMNHRLNSSSSSVTHQRLLQNPEEWQYYHSLYRDARKDWPIVPYKEAVKWCKARPHLVVGDFGCGEALLAKEVENKVYSFDHVAINEDVIACDIAHVPLDDETLDAAIFSLSLMGVNYLDYIKEAHRCLKLDGHLWIAETTSRYQGLSLFEEELAKIGFYLIRKQEKGNFTFLRLLKS